MTPTSPPASDGLFRVFARAFSKKPDNSREFAHFADYESALTAAARRAMDDLKALAKPNQSAKELFDRWRSKGADVFIAPDDPTTPFSATDFARLMVMQITLDQSRPLLLEVTCTDRLNLPSGYSSPPSQWVFWVKAPATYTNAAHLIRRASEYLYREMSQPALESEGSSYTLLDQMVRELDETEAREVLQNTTNKTIYTIQNDGSFAKFVP
ncbi:hypothetical protein IAD21_04547 [Abditibacteriota bacterium]|nr:hypothetical protein IAD21_04547 [Abditibacteriota bacterium]